MTEEQSLKRKISKIQKEYEQFDQEIDRCLKEEPKVAKKILALKEQYNLTDEQMKEIIKNAISMAEKYRKENKEQ